MELTYKTIDELVVRIDERNMSNEDIPLVGLSIDKCFIPSVANTIGTDLSKYKRIYKRDFAVSLMQVSRDSKIPIACLKEYDIAIMSPAYSIFRIKDEKVILPEYLEMWFRRSEFDREAAFIAVGGVRGSMPWEEFAMMKVAVPNIEKQKNFVRAYRAINDRIVLKKKINNNLTEQLVLANKQLFPLASDSKENINISDICEHIYSGGTPATTEDSFWNGKYPWLSSGETSNSYIIKTIKHISNEGIMNSSTKLASSGSTVIASAGQGLTRGQTSLLMIDTYVNQSIIVLKPKPGYSGFLYSNLKGRYNEMRNLSDLDSIRGSLTTKTVGALPVLKVSKEQLLQFESYCSKIFAMVNSNICEIELMQNCAANITSILLNH